MDSTQYFEHTLFYDCSPTSVEHYNTSAKYIFETEPSKLRLSVFFQSQRRETQRRKDKNESILLKRESGVVAQRDDREVPSRQRGYDNRPHSADSSSFSVQNSEGNVATALDLHQEHSIPPCFSQHQEAVSGYADLALNEIESFVERTRNDFRVFYLRQAISFGRLRVTRAIYERLISCCHVFPRFNEHLIAFCRRNSDPEIGPAPLKYRLLYTGHSRNGPGFECAYILRYVENTNRGPRKNPWSLRQYGVYHRFEPGRTGCSTMIVVGVLERMEKLVNQYTSGVNDVAAENPFELHVMFLDKVIASWRPYLIFMTDQISDMSNKALGVGISNEDDDENFVSITVEDHQELKQIEDQVADLLLCLDSTFETLTTFQLMYTQYLAYQDATKPADRLDAIAVSLKEKIREVTYTRRKVEGLLSKIQSTRTLISSLLERQSAHNINHQIRALREGNTIMQEIAEKNSKDSSSMRVLTILTMVYLPCTIVSNFYSTQFVKQIEPDGNSTRLGYAENAWLFFAISIPLTLFTFLVWYTWIHAGSMRSWLAAQLSTRKAELPL